MTYSKWTEEDAELLITLYEQTPHIPTKVIAKYLGRSYNSVRRKIGVLKIKRQYLPEPPLLDDVENEFSDEELVKIVGRIKYINKTEKSFPLPIPKPLIKRLKQQGLTVEEIKPVEVKA